MTSDSSVKGSLHKYSPAFLTEKQKVIVSAHVKYILELGQRSPPRLFSKQICKEYAARFEVPYLLD